MVEMPDDWIVVRIVENLFKKCSRDLTARYVTYFHPTEETRVLRQGRFVREYVPIFPTYLFVKSQFHYHLLEIEGIVNVVRSEFTDEPWRSRGLDRAINQLRKRADKFHVISRIEDVKHRSRYLRGDIVRATRGPFTDKIGRVDGYVNNSVKLEMNLFNMMANVIMREQDLVKVEDKKNKKAA